jgi:hypothetical protein
MPTQKDKLLSKVRKLIDEDNIIGEQFNSYVGDIYFDNSETEHLDAIKSWNNNELMRLVKVLESKRTKVMSKKLELTKDDLSTISELLWSYAEEGFDRSEAARIRRMSRKIDKVLGLM